MGALNDNVVVRIVGDASDVGPAVNQTEVSLEGLEPMLAELNASMKALTAQMAEGFASGAAGAKQLAVGIEETKIAAGGLGANLTGMIGKIHEGAESVRTFQMRAKEFAELYVAMFGAEIIAHWAESLGQAAEKVARLSAQTGMTTAQIQGLSGAATMSGTNIDALAKGLAMMDNKALQSTASTSSVTKAFHAMGIGANDGASNMQRLLTISDKFHGMADGPTKAALAMQLFGRSGREMIPFLNQGSAAIQDLIDKAKEYGVVNDKAEEQGERIAESVNLAKIAWEGLKNTLTEAFGPLLTEIVDGFSQLVQEMHESYESGGAVKIIFDTIVEVIQALGEVLATVGDAFSDLFTTTGATSKGWENAIKTVIDAVVVVLKGIIYTVELVALSFKSGCESIIGIVIGWYGQIRTQFQMAGLELDVLKIAFTTFGKVAADALTLHWGDIAADWNAGMTQIDNVVKARGAEIVADAKSVSDQSKSWLAAAAGDDAKAQALLNKDLNARHTAPKHDAPKIKFGGGTGDAPDISAPGSKGKKGKDDLVQQLEEQLEAKKAAWNAQQIAQDTAQQYSLQSEADFWAQALKRDDLSAKDRLAIEKAWIAASQALQKQRIENQLEQYKLDIDAAGQNWDKKLALLRDEQAYVTRMFGAESKEAKAAADAVIKAEKDKAKALRQLDDEIAKGREAAALAGVDAAQSAAEFEVEMGRETMGQLLAQEKQLENQRYQIQSTSLQERIALMQKDPTVSKAQLQQLYNEVEALARQHQQKLTDIDRKAVLERTQLERNGINQVAQGWAQNLAKLVTLQQGFAATWKGLLQTVQQAFASVIEGMIAKFISGELTKLAFGKTAAVSQLATQVALAGAGGTASMAAAPFPIDLGAPAFGASMAAAAASYGSIGLAEGGDWNVKEGLYGLHKNEMVLPAWAAQGVRNMIGSGSGAANSNPPSAANDAGGDSAPHFHFHGPVIGSRAAMEQWARDNRHMFGAGVHAFVRQGGNTSKF